MFYSLQEDKVIEEAIALLKKKSQNDTGHNYKLGKNAKRIAVTDFYRFSITVFSVSTTDTGVSGCLMYLIVAHLLLSCLSRFPFIFSGTKHVYNLSCWTNTSDWWENKANKKTKSWSKYFVIAFLTVTVIQPVESLKHAVHDVLFCFFLTLVEGYGQRMSHLFKALWDKLWFVNIGYTNLIWLIDSILNAS